MNCEYSEDLRDYVLGESAGAERFALETHLAACTACQEELRDLRLTMAALQTLPDREIPRRIAFVSDKVFSPSPLRRFFRGLWDSGPKLGFVSACLLAAAIMFSALHQKPEMLASKAPSATSTPAGFTTDDIELAVRNAVARVREEDARNTKAALAQVEHKYDEKQRALMLSVDENFQVLQKRLSSYTMLASSDASRMGGQ